MIPIKTSQELEIMKEGGKIAAEVLAKVLAKTEPGISTLELDGLAEKLISEAGGRPSFKGFDDYPLATCININEGIVHGLPTKRRLKAGDVLTVDLGVLYKGLHTDNANTVVVVGEQQFSSLVDSKNRRLDRTIQQFLLVGQKALKEAISQCKIGGHIGDVSSAIQTTIEKAGYNVARELGGHGVGRKLHEPPFIPGFGQPGTGPALKEGMTLAIEVIYMQGNGKIKTLDDGWTVVASSRSRGDGRLAGLFEHTAAVTKGGPVILTKL